MSVASVHAYHTQRVIRVKILSNGKKFCLNVTIIKRYGPPGNVFLVIITRYVLARKQKSSRSLWYQVIRERERKKWRLHLHPGGQSSITAG